MRALSALVLLAALPSAAHAFVAKETSKGARVHFRDTHQIFIAAQTHDTRKDQLLLDALTTAASAWNAPGQVTIEVRSGQRQVGYVSGGANENVVAYDLDAWDYDSDMLALTLVHYDVATGEIFDADTVINTEGYGWADRVEHPSVNGYDLGNTMTHELGHALGLAHSEVADATMFATSGKDETQKRDLSADDVAGLVEIYTNKEAVDPSAAGQPTVAGVPVGCSAAGSSPASLAAFLPLALIAWRRRRMAWIAGALGLLVASAAEAKEPTLRDVVRRAAVVVEARVVHQDVVRDARGLIVTRSTLRVEQCLIGSCQVTMVVEQLGGELDGEGLSVAGITPLSPDAAVTLALRQTPRGLVPVLGDRGILAIHARIAPEIVRALRLQIQDLGRGEKAQVDEIDLTR
ncbi:MAG: matrixin family metalloprotease [Myxococcota bacterium]